MQASMRRQKDDMYAHCMYGGVVGGSPDQVHAEGPAHAESGLLVLCKALTLHFV
jgi:hypothetical protein